MNQVQSTPYLVIDMGMSAEDCNAGIRDTLFTGSQGGLCVSSFWPQESEKSMAENNINKLPTLRGLGI